MVVEFDLNKNEDYNLHNLSSFDEEEIEYEVKTFYELDLKVGCFTFLEEDSVKNYVGKSYYIACWVEPEHVTKSDEFYCDFLGNVPFRCSWTLRMYDPAKMDPHLKLEVVRVSSKVDVGSSGGETVVGRTKVALPRLMNRTAEGILKLVRFSESGGCQYSGTIGMNMELKITTDKFRKYNWNFEG